MHRRDLLIGGGAVASAVAITSSPAAAAADTARLARSVTHGFHATMTARPGQGDALIALLLRAPAFGIPDCPVFLIGRSASEPDKIFVTEGWTSQAAHARFFSSEAAQGYVAELIPLVAGEAVYLDEVVVGGKADLT